MKIEIQQVPLEQKPIWRNLYPLYQFEESQWWPCPMNPFGVFDERPYIETLAQGTDWCNQYWEASGWRPLWILADAQIAGLAVVAGCATGLIPSHVDFELLDFWILPRFRGQGIGTEAATQIFQLESSNWPTGYNWNISVFETDVAALRFWRRFLAGVEVTSAKEERDDNGVNFYFQLKPALGNELADE